MSLLDHMEKEEIYFTEKTPDGRTEVYGLKDIAGVRRVDNYYKKYLAAYSAPFRISVEACYQYEGRKTRKGFF